jgi:hypothetical protein
MSQVGKSDSPPGVFLTINGNLSFCGETTISPEGIAINGKIFDTFPMPGGQISDSTSLGGDNMRFADDGIYLNQRRARLGPLDPNDKEELDVVQILIPRSYVGQLELRTRNDVKVDYWNGSLNILASHPASITIERVVGSPKCDIECDGYADVSIDKLEAKSLSVRTSKSSTLTIYRADADGVKLSASDNGQIIIRAGTCRKLETEGVKQSISYPASFWQQP